MMESLTKFLGSGVFQTNAALRKSLLIHLNQPLSAEAGETCGG